MGDSKTSIKIRVLRDVGGFKAGQVIGVPAVDGKPTDPFWIRRLNDARRDQCCEIVRTAPTAEDDTPKTSRKRRSNRSTEQ